MDGRVAWIGLALSYVMMLDVLELFTEDEGCMQAVYCLRGEDVAFYASE